MELPYNGGGLNRFKTFENIICNYLTVYSTSGSKKFETFETHQIHLKQPFSFGLQEVQTNLKLSKYIEFMWNYVIVLTSGSNSFEIFKTHQIHAKLPWSTSGLERLKSYTQWLAGTWRDEYILYSLCQSSHETPLYTSVMHNLISTVCSGHIVDDSLYQG